MKLTGIADEAGESLEPQIDATKALEIGRAHV